MFDITVLGIHFQKITPEQIFERLKNDCDNPELLKIMKDDVKRRTENGANKPGKQKCDNKSFSDPSLAKAGIEGDSDYFYQCHRNSLHYKGTHAIMVEDLQHHLRKDTDIIIVVAAGPHTPGIDKALMQRLPELQNSQKLTIEKVDKTLENDEWMKFAYGGTVEACKEVGAFLELKDKDVLHGNLHPEIIQAIDAKSKEPTETSFIQKLEVHFKEPTISSLMHQGCEDEALSRASNMKSQKSFLEVLQERRAKEGVNNGIKK